MLGLKSAPKEKVHGATALTAGQWKALLAKKTGDFLIVGSRADGEEYVSSPWDREAAQRIFDGAVECCAFTPGYRMKIVAVAPCSA
jgi:hypothetical protein